VTANPRVRSEMCPRVRSEMSGSRFLVEGVVVIRLDCLGRSRWSLVVGWFG
jgi:hypothetical protein